MDDRPALKDVAPPTRPPVSSIRNLKRVDAHNIPIAANLNRNSSAAGRRFVCLRSSHWLAYVARESFVFARRFSRGRGQSNFHLVGGHRGRQKEQHQHGASNVRRPRRVGGPAKFAKREITQPFAVQKMVLPTYSLVRRARPVARPGRKTLAFGIPMIERLHGTNACVRRGRRRPHASWRRRSFTYSARYRPCPRASSIAAVYGGAGIVKQARLAARAHILVATPQVTPSD